jgi:hypothetical protein
MARKKVRSYRVDERLGVTVHRWGHNEEFGEQSVALWLVDPNEPDRKHRLEMSVSTAANLATRLSEAVARCDEWEKWHRSGRLGQQP